MKSFQEAFVFGDGVEGLTPFEELLKYEDRVAELNIKINPDNDVCSVCFSSGTTGTPKGVMVLHRSLVGNTCQNS